MSTKENGRARPRLTYGQPNQLYETYLDDEEDIEKQRQEERRKSFWQRFKIASVSLLGGVVLHYLGSLIWEVYPLYVRPVQEHPPSTRGPDPPSDAFLRIPRCETRDLTEPEEGFRSISYSVLANEGAPNNEELRRLNKQPGQP